MRSHSRWIRRPWTPPGVRQAGIDRVNLGYQSLVPEEVARIGRRGGSRRAQALELALDAGFDNVCVDLIYGLERQTDDAWHTSLRTVAAMAPQTVWPIR